MEPSSIATYVRTVARLRNISAAARNLGITQPALSARLKRVESQLGAELFDRSTTPLTITDAGIAYLEAQDQIDAINHQLEVHIGNLQNLLSGNLIVGGTESFNTTLLPQAVAEFARTYPGINIQVITDTIPNLTIKALDGSLDIFITSSASNNQGLECEKLLTERIFLCLPIDSPFVDKLPPLGPDGLAWISQEDFTTLKDCPFIMLDQSVQEGRMMTDILKAYSFTPSKIIHADQTITSLALAYAGAGICMMPESALGKIIPAKLALYLPDKKPCTRTLYVAWQKSPSTSKAADAFAQILKKTVIQ